MDCLICHEQTGTYKKFPAGAGHPVKEATVFKGNNKKYFPPEWNKVAKSVSRPTRKNCGTCHFFGGGGDGIKHGDLDSSLFKPNKKLDVHMGIDGQNFDCIRCHSTTKHKIAGRIYTTPASKHRKSLTQDDMAHKITCESCHTDLPHKNKSKMNDHTDKVACQSCHIPEFARVNPTKMSWDWSTAGQKENGKLIIKKGDFNKPVYHTKKGSFVWEKNAKPVYFWYNGSMEHMTVRDTIDPGKIVELNRSSGNKDDPNSRIFPFKLHSGKQPYDKINKNMVIPQLFPKGKTDTTAYWKKYDWNKAIQFGMSYAGLKYSGEFDFVQTSYVFPITHMVAPKDNVVSCSECHTSSNSRLQNLAGFYMPARDDAGMIDTLGWILIFGSLIIVIIHGIGRIFTINKKEQN